VKNILILTLILIASSALALPPGHIELTFTAIPADGYRFYMDDCDIGGPTAAPVAEVGPGTTPFPGLLTDELEHLYCVRAFNNGFDPAGQPITAEQADPGQVVRYALGTLLPPGTVDDTMINGVCTAPCTFNLVVQ